MSTTTTQHQVAWGLDITPHAATLVRAAKTADGYHIDQYQRIPLEQANSPASHITAQISKLNIEPAAQPIAVCLSNKNILQRMLMLPKSDLQTIEKMVAAQKETLLPNQSESFQWDWDCDIHHPTNNKIPVWLSAARQNIVNTTAKYTAPLGQTPTAIVPTSICIACALSIFDIESKSLVVIDLAEDCTSIILLNPHGLQSCTVIDEGVEDWVDQLVMEQGIDHLNARQCLDNIGNLDDADPNLSTSCYQIIDAWAQQLREACASAVADIPASQRPQNNLLLQRHLNISCLTKYINAATATDNMHLKLADSRVELDDPTPVAQAAAAIGAAISILNPIYPNINLMPKRDLLTQGSRSITTNYAKLITWLVIVLAALVFFDFRHAKSLQAKLTQAVSHNDTPINLDQHLAIGRHVQSAGVSPLAILDELSRIAPEQALFSSWRYTKDGNIRMAGQLENNDELEKFINKLADAKTLTDIKLVNQKMEKGKCAFEITAIPNRWVNPATLKPPVEKEKKSAADEKSDSTENKPVTENDKPDQSSPIPDPDKPTPDTPTQQTETPQPTTTTSPASTQPTTQPGGDQ